MDSRTPKVDSKTPRTDAIDLRCLETIRDKTKHSARFDAWCELLIHARTLELALGEAELVLLSVAQDDCPRPVLDDPSIRACIEGGKCGCYWETCNIMKAALALGEQGREKG